MRAVALDEEAARLRRRITEIRQEAASVAAADERSSVPSLRRC
jgi:hypothetical protein